MARGGMGWGVFSMGTFAAWGAYCAFTVKSPKFYFVGLGIWILCAVVFEMIVDKDN